MKNSRYLFKAITAITILFSGFSVNAQNTEGDKGDTASYPYWIEMMQDPDANFYAVQSAFNKFFENRDFSEGWGYKVYYRWEYEWSMKIDADGYRSEADETFNNYQNYTSQVARNKRGPYGSNWTELGPILLPANGTTQPNGLGRVNEVAFHPDDENIIYAGAPAGGLWKTMDGGLTWESNTDDLPTLGVSAMVIDYTNPDIMYIGTGDRDGTNSSGLGVFKSTDGGETWVKWNTGMNNKTVSKLIMHPTDPLTIFAATNSGVYKTTDGGENWKSTSSTTLNVKDMVMKPNNPDVLYAAAGRFIYRSDDGGESFTSKSNGLATSGVRIALAVTPDEPDYLYALLSNQRTFKAFYLSTDSGESYTEQSSTPNILGYDRNGNDTKGQAWYDLDIAVEPGDASIVYVGGINIWKSTNFGQNWNISAHWTFNGGAGVADVHADQHVFEFSPHTGALYIGNDGGVYRSDDFGVTYEDISSGLAISQMYKIGQSPFLRNSVITGFQDNGTAIYTDGSWKTEIGGDGMECLYSPSDPTLVFGSLYYGDVRRSFNSGASFSKFAGNNTNGINEQGAWVSPYIIDENDGNTMYVGLKNIWRSNNIKGLSSNEIGWEKITNDEGGATANIVVLEQSPVNPELMFMCKNNNKLYRTVDLSMGAPTWKEFTMPVSRANDIECSPKNEDIVYLTGNKKVYKSVDKGQLWTDMSGTLPSVNIFCIIFDETTDEGLYIGTDAGVYFYDADLEDWIPYLTGLPVNVDVRELEIYHDQLDPSLSVIRAGTYGRGLWQSPLFGSSMATFSADLTSVCKRDTVTFTADETGATSWNWTFEGGEPATSTDEVVKVVYNETGDFKVTLIASDGIDSDTIVRENYIDVCSPASTGARTLVGLVLYPNPANDNFTIDLAGNTDPVKVEMYDVNGRRVRQIYSGPTESIIVRTDAMPTGIYYIKVYMGTEVLSGKVSITR